MRSLLSALRSRRIAFWSIVGLAVYASAMTLVPQGAVDLPEVAAWREAYPLLAGVAAVLGLHRAWSNPAFVVAVAWLTLSTATCAWERTAASLRRWRKWRDPEGSGYLGVARSACAAGVAWTPREVPAPPAVAAALRMRARSAGEGIWATSQLWGLSGSPLFHWSLALLAVIAIGNQMTAWQGGMGVIVGHPRTDEAASLESLTFGPLASYRRTGTSIALERTEASHIVDGADRGGAAFVTATRDGATVRSGWVLANVPMRLSDRTLHLQGEGLGAVFVTELADGSVAGEAQMLAKRAELADGQVFTRDMTVRTESGDVVIRMAMSLGVMERGEKGSGGPRKGMLEYSVLDSEGRPGEAKTITVGEAITVPDGSARIVYKDFGHSAYFLVVHEPWLVWLSPVLALGLLGAALAILFPARAVFICADPAVSGGTTWRVVVRVARVDAGFRDRVLAALGCAAEVGPADEGGTG